MRVMQQRQPGQMSPEDDAGEATRTDVPEDDAAEATSVDQC